MIEIDYKSRDPIYLQIIHSIKKNIMLGNLRENDQLPAVRQLAVDLGINPNTVQKAYRELDREEITYTVPGKGSFVGTPKVIASEVRRDFRERFAALVQESLNFGIPPEDIRDAVIALLDQVISREERDD